MSDLRQQLREHYEAQSLSAEKVRLILAGAEAPAVAEKIVRFPRRWIAGLALAASLAVFAGLALWWTRPAKEPSFAVLAPRVVEFFGQPPELPKRSQNPEELRTWLLAQGAPADMQIPAKLGALKSFGCQVVDVHGRPAFLTCFWKDKKPGADDGQLVHLFVVHRGDFRDAPPAGTPQFRELDGWSFASWTEGDAIYTMAAAAPMEALRLFVAVRPDANVLLAMR